MRRHCAAVTLGLALCQLRVLATGPQELTRERPVSLERIRHKVEQAPARPLDLRVQPSVPIATFRVEVQRRFVLTLEEQLHKEFDLTPAQRQFQQWEARCCGVDLGELLKPVGRALKRRQESRVREQIARELAHLRVAADQQPPK